MAVSKVEYYGKVLLDLTGDTVAPETLAKGTTAHDKSGAAIVGTMEGGGGSSVPSATSTNIYEPAANVRDLGDGTIIFESNDPNPQASISAFGSSGYLDKPFAIDANTKNFVMAYSTDAKVASAIGLTADKIVSGNTVLGIAGTGGGGGGSTKNVQAYCGAASVTSTSYTATAVSLTVAKTGTYKVSWCGCRNTNSGTSGSQLYINNSAYGSAQTSFSNTYFQNVVLNNVSLTAGQTIVVRARARSTSYVMWVGNLIIEQTA